MLQGLFFGPIYEGQCDSWYTNVVLLGREIYVSKGDKIFLKTEANLTNFQREQQMVRLIQHLRRARAYCTNISDATPDFLADLTLPLALDQFAIL